MTTRRNRTDRLIWVCLLPLAWMVGCTSAPRQEEQAPSSVLGLGVEARPGSVLTVRDAYPFVALAPDAPVPGVEVKDPSGAMVSRWEVLEGEHAGKVIRQERIQDGDDSWRIRSVLEGEGTELNEQVLRFDRSTGAVVLMDTKQFDEHIRVVMRPQPEAMPAELHEGRVVTQKMSLRMPYLDDPSRLRAQGAGQMTLEYDADQSVTLEGRSVDARRVREVFTTNVTAASAVRTIERWFVPGMGRVAERWEEDLKMLGLISERTAQSVRLLPP